MESFILQYKCLYFPLHTDVRLKFRFSESIFPRLSSDQWHLSVSNINLNISHSILRSDLSSDSASPYFSACSETHENFQSITHVFTFPYQFLKSELSSDSASPQFSDCSETFENFHSPNTNVYIPCTRARLGRYGREL